MSKLAFLSPALAEAGYRSPLERALAETKLRDLSSLGKVEVRGELDGATLDRVEVVRITPNRALLLCEAEAAPKLADRLNGIDLSAALAGFAVQGEQLLHRLTDLDLEQLPAVGAVAGVRCTVLRDENEFRLLFPQEYADHVAAVVLDAAAGLR